MLENKKHVFWQAFFLTMLVFGLGLVSGIYFEQMRTDNSNILFYQSESSLFDTLALINLINLDKLSCDELIESHVRFADKIFDEARNIDKLEQSNKITDSLKLIHKKYDLLRTILWISAIDLKEKCAGVNTVVYLYVFDEDDIGKKAKQVTFSKLLIDLKDKRGNNIILIPIAVDQEIASLDYLMEKYKVNEFPTVSINEETIIIDLLSIEDLEQYLE